MLALAVLGNTGASLILKLASLPRYRIDFTSLPPSLLGVCVVIAALGCYALAFIAYMLALRSLSVSIAYPLITSISVVLIATLANLIFRESITPISIVGIFLILAGVTLLMGGAR
jgi:multidrug transporter EmrE-like cation transporter